MRGEAEQGRGVGQGKDRRKAGVEWKGKADDEEHLCYLSFVGTISIFFEVAFFVEANLRNFLFV